MSVPTEFHSTLCGTYHTLCISVRQPITEVKAEWNVAADVWEIASECLERITGKRSRDKHQFCRSQKRQSEKKIYQLQVIFYEIRHEGGQDPRPEARSGGGSLNDAFLNENRFTIK